MPLTSAGYTATRAADYLDTIRQRYEAATGLTVDWDRDQALGVLTVIMADLLGELDQTAEAAYGARVRNNATGIQLDDLGSIVGVTRDPASYSTATVTLTGTAGVVVVEGSLVEGGGDDDRARWTVTQDYTIGGGGTVSALVRCTTAGEVIAGPTEIDKIVTPITGWTAVSNPAAAIAGSDQEDDATYRRRQVSSLQIAGSANVAAIRSQLVALDYVEAATVQENDAGIVQVINGITMPGHSLAAILWPSGLTSAQEDEVALLLYQHTPAGTEMLGTESATVTKADGISKTVYWYYATATGTTVAYVVALNPGYVLTDVDVPLSDAVEAWFSTLAVGQDVTLLDLQTLAGGIIDENTGGKKIKTISSLLIDGAAADKTVTSTQVATFTSCTVTT